MADEPTEELHDDVTPLAAPQGTEEGPAMDSETEPGSAQQPPPPIDDNGEYEVDEDGHLVDMYGRRVDGGGDGSAGSGGEVAVSAAEGSSEVDPVQAAMDQFPMTLLHYDPPEVYDLNADGQFPDGKHPVLLPVFEQQRQVLSVAPIVTSTDRLLHAMLPPQEVTVTTRDGAKKRIIRKVHEKQALRKELAELKELLEFKLKDAKARMVGICAVRRSIFAMLFDEVLRQVAIDCPERGLLLLRVRDQLRMTFDAQSALYDASVTYTRLRMHEATKAKPQLMEKVAQLTENRDKLKREVRRLEAKHEAMLRCVEEQQTLEQKKFGEEKLFLERTKQRLVQHIEAVKEMQENERRALRGLAAE